MRALLPDIFLRAMGEIIMFSGGLLLLFSWVTQTFLYGKWNRRLDEIRNARNVFFTYQSNNAIFSAISQITPPNKKDRLWEFQTRNYEYGLKHVRRVLSKKRAHQLSEKVLTRSKEVPYSSMGEHGYKAAEVVVIQEELLDEKELIETNEARAQKAFWALYVLGSLCILIGNLLPK